MSGDWLEQQVVGWSRDNGDCLVETCAERLVPPIRAVLDRTDVVVIDASEDGPQAADTFCLAASCLGARATGVYTEQMHEGLELLVHMRGSQLLLGTLDAAQWEGFFQQTLPARKRAPHSWKMAA